MIVSGLILLLTEPCLKRSQSRGGLRFAKRTAPPQKNILRARIADLTSARKIIIPCHVPVARDLTSRHDWDRPGRGPLSTYYVVVTHTLKMSQRFVRCQTRAIGSSHQPMRGAPHALRRLSLLWSYRWPWMQLCARHGPPPRYGSAPVG